VAARGRMRVLLGAEWPGSWDTGAALHMVAQVGESIRVLDKGHMLYIICVM